MHTDDFQGQDAKHDEPSPRSREANFSAFNAGSVRPKGFVSDNMVKVVERFMTEFARCAALASRRFRP